MGKRFPKVVFALFVGVCLCGCCMVYLVDIERDVSVTLNPDWSVTFRIDGFLPEEYSYMILDNVRSYDAIYFYYDERYPVLDDTHSKLLTLYDTLHRMTASRGYHSFEKVDADRLKDVMSDTSMAQHVAVMVASGAMPDTVLDQNGSPLMESWFSAGGTMYWMSGNPCSYYSTQEGIVETGSGLFDDSLFNTEVSDEGATDCSEIAEVFGFGYSALSDAIRCDAPGSRVLGLTDGTYSSLSVLPTPYGGTVYIFGGSSGTMTFEQCSAFADMLVCGVTRDTIVIEKVNGHKGYGGLSVTTSPIVNGDLFFFRIGSPNTDRGAILHL